MPRTKVITSSKTTSKTGPKKVLEKKKPIKKIEAAPKNKKIKKVIVDIIKDDDRNVFNSKPFEETASENTVEEDEEIYRSLVTEKYEDEPLPVEIDSQKKFFSQLIKEVDPKNNNYKNDNNSPQRVNGTDEAVPAKSVHLYRSLVWKFLAATIALLGIVFYFSFTKLTIEINPKGEVLNSSLFLKISVAKSLETGTSTVSQKNDGDPQTPISGDIKVITSSLEAVYPVSGEEFGTEELSGSVKIINNSDKAQALIATTRLLSSDNKLFRIKKAVNVPAGGEATVDVYADKPGPDMAIGATTFIIPGLWAGLQDKIFARSDTEFTYEKKVKKTVKQTDIENAAKDINERLINNASSSISDVSSSWFFIVSDKTKIVYNAKAGDVVDKFSAKADGNVTGVSFSKEEATKLATAKLRLLVPDDKELIEFKPENISYTLDSYDASTNTAIVKATFSGTMALKSDSTIIDRAQLVNLTKLQIDNYLKDLPEIKSYELKFFPSFIKKAPSLADRINIVIDKINN